MWDDSLSVLRVARLAENLPPEAMIRRGEDLDSRYFSLEAQLLRMWINMNLESKDRLKTVEDAQADEERKQRNQLKAQQRAEQLARRRAVTGGD